MPVYAVTAIGADRPGIVAAVTAVVADLGGNLEDSSSTILRGQFAMTLIVSVDQTAEAVDAAIAPVADRLSLLVAVRPVAADLPPLPLGAPYVLTVRGADHPGIVSAVTAVIAGRGGNLTSLRTSLSRNLYVLVADVDLPADTDIDGLQEDLRVIADHEHVAATLHRADGELL